MTMREPLTNSVSVQELLEMRESGLSNQQIAERLDVGYSTICRYIGKNPKQAKRVNFKPEMVRKDPTLLKVVEEMVTLSGSTHDFSVNKTDNVVYIKDSGKTYDYTREQLEVYISELLEILGMLKGDDDEQGATQG